MIHTAVNRSCEDHYHLLRACFLLCCPIYAGCAVWHAVDFHISGWLNVLRLIHHHFDLSTQQFHDALCLCYHCPLSLMPAPCDGCAMEVILASGLILL